MVIWQVLGLGLAAMGVYSLYFAWQRKARSWPLVVAGWVLVLGSITSWSQTSGVDKGPALGVVAVILVALITIIAAAIKAPVKTRRTITPRQPQQSWQASVWHEGLSITASILAIAILALIAALASCTAMFMAGRAVGLEHTANLTLSMFAFPMAWAGLATFIGYSTSTFLRAAVLLGLAVVSAAIILVTMQGGG